MSSAWAAVIVAALTLAAAALGAVIRLTVHWTRLSGRLSANTDRIGELVSQLREDRAATNARLTWLERNSYRRGRGRHENGD